MDINNGNEIVGFYNDDEGFTTSGFLRTRRGRFIDIFVPTSLVTGPLKSNDRRQVVGLYVGAAGEVHGFLEDDGKVRTIDVAGAAATVVFGINNRGQRLRDEAGGSRRQLDGGAGRLGGGLRQASEACLAWLP